MKQAFYLYARAIAMFMVASLVLAAGCKSGENTANVPQAKPVDRDAAPVTSKFRPAAAECGKADPP